MRLHFISGLPRSRSTLLARLLRQNPRFRAAMPRTVSGPRWPSLSQKIGAGEPRQRGLAGRAKAAAQQWS
jgi:hypothetical protein